MYDYEGFFAADGALAAQIDGYAPRPQQSAMARAVDEALHERQTLIVEAGTGIGKTFAYLVPALLAGCKVVISTHTRTLQDQLFARDLPLLGGALGRPVKVALLKGRSNYLCRHRFALADADLRLRSREQLAHWSRIRQWVRRTRDGDIAEVSGVPEDAIVWSQATSTTENCLGTECPVYQECHVVRARRAAQDADIVVVNHHLLLADFVLREEGFGELLPDAEAIIVDEAHQIPDVATRFFGVRIASRQIRSLARDLLAEALHAGGQLGDWQPLADGLTHALDELRLAIGSSGGRQLQDTLSPDFIDRVAALDRALEQVGSTLAGQASPGPGLEACARRADDCRQRLAQVAAGDTGEAVRWIESGRREFSMYLTPLDTAENLGAIYAKTQRAWVFTSATLAVGDDFSHFAARVGAPDAHTLKLDSPFDYESNALLYLPGDLPEPSAADYTARVVVKARPVIEASGGRAFVLFTSHRALRLAADLLGDTLGFPLLVQGTAPRDELLTRFRQLGNAVLLGTGSFWEGVDVRGSALSVVVIDKLPFAAPGDPVFSARLDAIRAAGGNPFMDYQLPQAIIALKQGAGRLIRDQLDRGVMMLCDPRLRSRAYGRIFLHSLPPMARTADVVDVERFFAAEKAAVE